MHRSFTTLRMTLTLMALLPTVSCAQQQTGLKLTIVSHAENAGMPHMPPPMDVRSTVYVSGTNHRIERVVEMYRGVHWHTALIERCAEHVTYNLNLDTQEYTELPQPVAASEKNTNGAPNVIFDTTTVDTGETRQAFGHTAHRYVTTTHTTQAAELGGGGEEIVEDVWYLDLPDALMCTSSHRKHGVIGATIRNDRGTTPEIRPEFRYQGPDPQGLALLTKHTSRQTEKYVTGESHHVVSTFTTEIVDLKEQRIDASMFSVPKGFTKVANFTLK